MRFASLGSGSGGNATLIESGETCVMLDCGFSATEAERRLARLGKHPSDIDAVLVTHEHGDHVAGVGAFCRRHRVPVWLTHGTSQAARVGVLPVAHTIDGHSAFAIGDILLQPFPVPHDAREPVQFVFSDGARRLGVLTDLGEITPHVLAVLAGCDALMLECNHDSQMLAQGPYPPSLKQRVGGRLGHLNNRQAADCLAAIHHAGLQHVIGVHLSEKNNRPALAQAALAAAMGCSPREVDLAAQGGGFSWREISLSSAV